MLQDEPQCAETSRDVPRRAEMSQDEQWWAETSLDETKLAESSHDEPKYNTYIPQKPCDRSCHKSSNICQAKISVGLELGLTKNQPSTMPDCKGQPNMLRRVGTRSAARQTLLVSVKRKSLDRRSERTRLSRPAQDKTRVGQIQLKRSGQIVREFLVKPTMAEQFSNEREMTKRCQFDSKKPDVALPKNY